MWIILPLNTIGHVCTEMGPGDLADVSLIPDNCNDPVK